jgi:hypothetical protein
MLEIGYIEQCVISDGIVTELHSGYYESSVFWKWTFNGLHGIISHKRTIPTERPPLVSEASANFCR